MAWSKFDKLVELIKRRITQVVLYKMKDPRIGFITVTKIDLARDLKLCKVFYTVFGSEADVSKTRFALNDARGYIQGEVGKSLHTRTIPRIEFVLDEASERAERVHKILDSLRPEEPEEEPEKEAGSDPDNEDPGDEDPGDEDPGDEEETREE